MRVVRGMRTCHTALCGRLQASHCQNKQLSEMARKAPASSESQRCRKPLLESPSATHARQKVELQKRKNGNRKGMHHVAIKLWRSTNITTMVKLDMLWLWKIYSNDKMFRRLLRLMTQKTQKTCCFKTCCVSGDVVRASWPPMATALVGRAS